MHLKKSCTRNMFHYHLLHESKSNLKDDKKTRRILSFEKGRQYLMLYYFNIFVVLVPILLYQEYQYEI